MTEGSSLKVLNDMKNTIKPHLKAVTASLALILSACVQNNNVPVDMGATIAVVPKLIGTLYPVNNSNIRGAVAISPSANYKGTLAIVSISGGTVGAQIPWQLQQGSCTAPGSALGSQKNYPVFIPAADGNANVEVVLPFSIKMKQSYSVTVQSPSEPGQTAACADLYTPQEPN